MTPTQTERFWSNVDKTEPDQCWLWLGNINPDGYGRFSFREDGKFRTVFAHRLAYELSVGPIPPGLTIDHVRARGCQSTACVNPAHLEPVTNRENLRRGDGVAAKNTAKTHCDFGHPLSGDNLKIDSRGFRVCRACQARRAAEQRKRRDAAEGSLASLLADLTGLADEYANLTDFDVPHLNALLGLHAKYTPDTTTDSNGGTE